MNSPQWPATADGIEAAGNAAETKSGAFAVGDLLLIDGQVFTCIRLTPFWSRRRGCEISLAVFSSLCPDCGGDFEVSVKAICPRPVARIRGRLPRRCPFCRAAGRRVSKVLHLPATETFAAPSATCRATGTHENNEDESNAGSQGTVALQGALPASRVPRARQ